MGLGFGSWPPPRGFASCVVCGVRSVWVALVVLCEVCLCAYVSVAWSEKSRDLLCAVLFGHLFACKVFGTCSGIWFSGIFGVVLCPGVTSGLSGVFLGGRVIGCWYVWRCVFVCSVYLPIMYVIEGM